MSENVDQSLQKIAKGSVIVFSGSIAGILLSLGSRVLFTRFFTESEYGIYSLALAVLTILITISILGFEQGSTRQIAYYRGGGDALKVQGVIVSSLQITLIASIACSAILFLTSDIISLRLFHEAGLSIPLKIFSVAIPFSVLTAMFVSVFRGFDNVKPRIYFQEILRNGLFPLLLVPVVFFGLPFFGAIYAFLASVIIACAAITIYAIKKASFSIAIKTPKPSTISPIGKELFLFSLPLLGVNMLSILGNWTDTMVLGYFETSKAVGLYYAALPLANLIPLILGSIRFIYVPIVSQLYLKNLLEDTARVYQVTTKWIFSVSFLIFILLFLFPKTVLSFIFGVQYAEAALALRIVAAGLMFASFLGLNGMTLLVIGKTRLLLWASLLGAISNVVLSIVLIPRWGIAGAATALLVSRVVVNIFNSVKLYHLTGIHPFSRNYLKCIFISGVLSAIIYIAVGDLVSFWMLPVIAVLFVVLFGLSLVVTKGFDSEDIMLLGAVERQMGINLEPIKRLLRRFV